MRYRSFVRAGLEQIKRSLPFILLLRKPDLSFSFAVKQEQDSCDLDDRSSFSDASERALKSSSNRNIGDPKMADQNGLLLYYNAFSFYSQKVVMALHEKNLKFDVRDIDLNGEQYKPWFLQINPKGEVPVLQDTGKIIPDSARIIDYLEDNFSNGDTPRLIPMDQGSEIRQKVTFFRGLIDKINGNVLTIGSFLHPEFANGPKRVPFIAPVRKQLVKADEESAANLRRYAEETPGARAMLLEKAENQEKKREKLLNKQEFIKILNQAEEVFDKIEAELAEHTKDQEEWWLCSDRFTVADVSLTILMVRISQIGMEPYFWSNGKRPYMEYYFERVQDRESYDKTVPTTFTLIKTIFKTQAPLLLGGLFRRQNH
ncbi:hypothetical protein ABEB36_001551 [Hypothenemus hampei]|uniref:Ganglioside-induced differentiation-associated protein 1 n=1 Tax=Hypothenemus hampei TaxID=57062 RepID=A0ABD1FHG1_HYPHA